MKLLYVHQNLGDFGGAESFICLTGRELRARGHELALLYRQATGRNEPRWHEIFSRSFCLSSKGNVEMLEAVLERSNPDLLFVNNWDDLQSFEALLGLGIPVVRMVHDHSLYCMRGYKYNYFSRKVCTRSASGYCVFPCLGPLVRNAKGPFPLKWASYAEKKREIILNQRCEAVLAYSEYQRRELLGNGFSPDRVHLTAPMDIHNPGASSASFSDRNLILFVGQVIRGKGVDALLRALAKVRAPFECIILGDGNHRAKCERLSLRLGLGQRVHFSGYVSPELLRDYYLQASLFVMSSLWPEPFGMAGPEAMRYGLPVVAFDSGAISEWLTNGENGFLVPWNDTSAFAARVEELLRNKALARKMGLRAMASVRRFDAPDQVDALEGIFKRLAGFETTAKAADPSRPLVNAATVISARIPAYEP